MQTENTQTRQPRRQKLIGVVSSAAGDKTIRVVVSSQVKHPRYGKYLVRHTKLAVHDPKNSAAVGDTVEITTCRRISKSKNFRLLQVLKKAAMEAAPTPAERG